MQYQDIRGDMDKYWPALNAGMHNEDFWWHEWTGHGSCQKEFQPHDYYKKAIKLKNDISPLNILQDANIFPGSSNPYTQKAIFKAFENVLGIGNKIWLTCHKKNGHFLLREVVVARRLEGTGSQSSSQ
ncbi:unnamed protein product [Ilex paraguariensis]|uniref:Uncharacterized protein n=1 Tax=Ilex paraguariensis TaxID=185542 RepID=A0ABC8R8H3_9AQUA